MVDKRDINKVADTEFWKDRLEKAKNRGRLHTSIYEAGDEVMDQINEAHFNVINELIKPEEKVLDAGCGYGRVADWFTPEQYIGVDFSKDFIAEAHKLHPEYKFILSDLKSLPFEDKEFDWSIMLSIKHMIVYYLGEDAWVDIEKEIKRVSKKVLILEYTNPSNYTIL